MTPNPDIWFNDIHPRDMTGKDWLDDLESLFTLMRDNNPYLALTERVLGYNWLDLYDRYFERMKSAETIDDYLGILHDAVQAMQNGHTVIINPDWLESFFEVEYYRKTKPFSEVFSDRLKEYYQYWKSHFDAFLKEHNMHNFEVCAWYNNGDYVIEAGYGEWESKYGRHTRIIAVNGQPIHEAVRGRYEKGILNYDFQRDIFYFFRIQPRHFGAKAEFTIQTPSGEERNVVFASGYEFPYSITTVYPVLRLETENWPEKRSAYVRIGDFEDHLADDDHEVLMEFYKKIENYELLIVDVRGNQGGCYEPWMRNVIAPLARKKLGSKMYLAFRSGRYVDMFRKVAEIGPVVSKEQFKSLPPEVLSDDYTIYDYTQTVEPTHEIDFKGKIILLVDSITFSATDAFALFCKETGFAKLYGNATGGDGISDSPIYYILPNSKLLVRFTPGMGIDHTGHANEEVRVQPDVYHESPFGDLEELVTFVMNQELGQSEF